MARGTLTLGLVAAVVAGGGTAGRAVAQDGVTNAPGRAGARAGAGAAAADDPFAVTRNPAATARVRGPSVAVGGVGTVWRLAPHRSALRVRPRSRVLGAPAIAGVWPLARARVAGWRDPFDIPLRAGFALQDAPAMQGDGSIEVQFDAKPALIEVRARGTFCDLRNIEMQVWPLVGDAPIASEKSRGGRVSSVDFRRLAQWADPKWPATGRARVVVRYTYRFRMVRGEAAPESERLQVRLDVGGRELSRREHQRPAAKPTPPTGTPPTTSGDGPPSTGGAIAAGDSAADRGPEDPDPDLVRRLERGEWRVGIALTPEAMSASTVDAPTAITGYRMGLLTEAATVTLGRSYGDRFALGVGAKVYASAVTGMQLPVTLPDGFGGSQAGALSIDRAFTVGLGFSLGALWDVTDTVTAGLHYHSRSFLGSHRGTAEVSGLTIFGGPTGITTGEWDVAIRHLGLPQRVGAALAWRPSKETLLLSADLTWWDWSDQLNDVRLVLDSPNQAAFLATGVNTTRIRIPLNWEDRFVLALGGTWRALPQWMLHAGYRYGRNPFTAGSGHPILPSITRHHVAAGTTVKVGQFVVDAQVAYGLPEDVHVSGAAGLTGVRLKVSEFSAAVSLTIEF